MSVELVTGGAGAGKVIFYCNDSNTGKAEALAQTKRISKIFKQKVVLLYNNVETNPNEWSTYPTLSKRWASAITEQAQLGRRVVVLACGGGVGIAEGALIQVAKQTDNTFQDQIHCYGVCGDSLLSTSTTVYGDNPFVLASQVDNYICAQRPKPVEVKQSVWDKMRTSTQKERELSGIGLGNKRFSLTLRDTIRSTGSLFLVNEEFGLPKIFKRIALKEAQPLSRARSPTV